MSDTHATRGRRVLAFLLGLLLAFSMLPAEALAFVRDEVVVLGEEEGVGEVVVDGGVDLLEQEEDPDQKKLSADSVSGEFVYTAQSNELKKPEFEKKIADVNDSEG
ncbi:MAG: hypothetical protein IKG18_03875, partial [Atopobiaceae bacterium]|nr:hypothetical protein [Atopobiaceae bacterium]